MRDEEDAVDETLLEPMRKTSYRFYILVIVSLAVIGLGAYAYITQLQGGLAVTGLNDRVSWGMYISNLIFFIGISYGGTLVSAVLRLTNAEWRKPITRLAETTTVMALVVSLAFILTDLGRPDRMQNMLIFGRLESALVWDMIGLFSYLVGALLFLYLPMIPDLAIVRKRLKVGRFRTFIYNLLSRGWVGSKLQERTLEKSIAIIAIIIIPVAISVHTVLSWIFAMTLRVGWHTAIFGPFFVGGAIFSGIAIVIIAMAVFRRIYHLERYITVKHFRYLGSLLLILNLVMIYFTISEYLTAAYGAETHDALWLDILTTGPYGYLFWFMLVTGFVLPAFLLVFKRSVGGIVLASVLVNVGMWIERFLIVVGSLMVPQIGETINMYAPSWVEWSITAAGFAAFVLLCAVFSKFFPIVSIWETKREPAEVAEAKPVSGEVLD